MRIVILIALMAAFVTAQSSSEWPIPHNIGHTGFSPTTVLQPPFKVKWTTYVAGLISGESGNGPVVAEGKVLIQGHYQNLVCLDAETGELLWRTSITQSEYPYKWHFYPCIADGRAYAVFSVRGDTAANGIRAFNLNTGELIWKKDAGFISSFRMKDSPQYSNGKVFLHSVRDVNHANLTSPDFKSQVQAWDAATGDTLWTFTVWDSIPSKNTSNPGEVNPSLCVVGDTVFASCGAAGSGGRTVALTLDGGLIWDDTAYHVDNYTGNIQYTGDKLLVLSAYGGANSMRALNARTGALVYSSSAVSSYSKVSALMNGKGWNRGYGAAPGSFDLATGVGSSGTRTITGDGYGSGCSAPRAANGNIFVGFGGPVGQNDIPKLYAWNEAGDPAWWFPTPDTSAIRHVCQDVAIAYDKMYWLTNGTGQVFCFESDTRTMASVKAIWEPDTLEQYWFGKVKAVVSFTDGSKDTTVVSCKMSNLDTNQCLLRVEGAVYAKKLGTALIRVERYGMADTARIPVMASKSILDTPVFVRRINFQASWKPFMYGWLVDNGGGYSAAQGYGWVRPQDLQVAREDRLGNYLLRSFLLTANSGATATPYKIDAPDGHYIIRLAMGDNAWGGATYCYTVYNGDTLCTISRTGNQTATDTLHVTGGQGITLTVAGFINYIVLVSMNGSDQFCDLVDDFYGCPGTAIEKQPVTTAGASLGIAPNPFNRSTLITGKGIASNIMIFDIHGSRVASFAPAQGGYLWNALSCPAGVYMVVAKTAEGRTLCRKVTLMK